MVRECQLKVGQTVVTVIDVGAAIRSVQFSDRAGQVDDVVLGHPTLEDYKVRAIYIPKGPNEQN